MSFISSFNSLSTNGWSAKISNQFTPISIVSNANVGFDLAISEDGNYVIASNPFANSAGIIKVYTVNNTVLTNQATIVGNVEGGKVVTRFGSSIDIDYDGTRLVSGSIQNGLSNVQAGSARIYLRTGTTWSFEQQIDPPVSNTFWFGQGVTINNSGDTIAVAQDYAGGTSSVYTYSRSGTTWSPVANIHTPVPSIAFGSSIAMDNNNTLVIGAFRSNVNGTFSGAAYVYNANGTLLSTLTASDGAANDNFGAEVNISNDGNTILVVAPGANSSNGAAYVFKGSGNTWTQVQKLLAFGDTGGITPTDDISTQGLSGNGSIVALSATYSNTANYTSILTYQDINNSNNYTNGQQLQYPNLQFFGSVIDMNYSGSLMITSAGNNSTIGSLILLGN